MNAKTEPKVIVETIVAELDGREWGSDTLDAIAQYLRQCGYAIRSPEEADADEAAL